MAPVLLLVLILASLLPRGREGVPFLTVLFVGSLATFFIFFMGCLHLLKALVADYLLEGRWDPDSRMWRAVIGSSAGRRGRLRVGHRRRAVAAVKR